MRKHGQQPRDHASASKGACAEDASDVVVLDNTWLDDQRLDHSCRDNQQLHASARKEPSRITGLTNRAWYRLGPTMVAGCVTLALHTVLIAPLVLGSGAKKSAKPPIEGTSIVPLMGEPDDEGALLLIVNDTTITPDDRRSEGMEAAVMQASDLMARSILSASIQVAQPIVSFASEHEAAPSDEEQSSGNGGELAMLFGRYMGQVKSRIERAWAVPAAATLPNFKCRVQIKQSKRGVVQEVTLQRCDKDAAWQLSLVQAIQSASPLSAPPSETVFTEYVSLDFQQQVATSAAASSAAQQSHGRSPAHLHAHPKLTF